MALEGGSHPDFRTALAAALDALLEGGIETLPEEKRSISHGRRCTERLSASFQVDDPRCPLSRQAAHGFHAAGAVARLLWILRGESSIAPLRPYWGEALYRMSDDGTTLAGSNTGARIFGLQIGGHQYAAARERLREHSTTRRAFLSVFNPDDAVRQSHDIPCTIGLSFQLRQGTLYSHILMRANDAYNLLPYNWLEYATLSALMAHDVGATPGPMAYTACTLHLYHRDRDAARRFIQAPPAPGPRVLLGPEPWEDIHNLARVEERLRDMRLTSEERNAVGLEAAARCHGIWKQFALILTEFHVGHQDPDRQALGRLDDAWKPFVGRVSSQMAGPEEAAGPPKT